MGMVGVTHNIEMGHRLSRQPHMKCYHLHGHSWFVELSIFGPKDQDGMILEFGDVKAKWRGFLDESYDHHMLLNPDDPLVDSCDIHQLADWGITLMPQRVDPTVENVAEMFAFNAQYIFGPHYQYHIKLREAASNWAEFGYRTYDRMDHDE
jgi:6-pyruvoyltetrahydropterin/6-carboxytetrahydropterin synthase